MAKKREEDMIVVKGARTHNLKNIDVTMPRGKMVAITGKSGSGKSSLAFDTVFAEGQRRYVESLSAYARQFLNQMPKPDVDEITGLSPAISIDQKSRSNNPRSTVATITEIYDYVRVLYARIGRPHSPISGKEVRKLSNQEIVAFGKARVFELEKRAKKLQKNVMGVKWSEASVYVFAPVVRGRKGEYYQMLYDLLAKGYRQVRIDGVLKNLREPVELSKNVKHDIDVLIDSFAVHELKDNPNEFDMRFGEAVEKSILEADGFIRIIVGEPEPKKRTEDTITEDTILSAKLVCPEDGYVFPEIEPRLFSFNSPYGACPACNGLGTKYMFGDDPCETCRGARLREEALNVFLGGKEKGKNILEFATLSVQDALTFMGSVALSDKEREIGKFIIKEITDRLQFMLNVGLEYLSLDRKAHTLSGGESQRIRLASQLGSRLVGATYVLDEPTIGLHQRDNDKLIDTLLELRDLGNTIIVVEHDEDTIYASDYIVDIGPYAGVHGGQVVAMGWLDELLSKKKLDKSESASRTLGYLRGELTIPIPESRRTKDLGWVTVEGASINNIVNQNFKIPVARMTCITGVSGSGKSSFMYEVLHKNLQARYEKKYRSAKTYNCAKITGLDTIARAILIDQSPIGRTPRSNVATYTGAWTFIREMFAETEESRIRGWKQNRFSFNVKGGRCEACEGRGEIAVEMHFLPTVYVTCEVCEGKRFDKETLKVKYKGKTIHDVLKMTVEEGVVFFKDIASISDRLETLQAVGLGYIEIGQNATTLSGGEAQRVKIASELYRPFTERTLYLLDEPTVGLHYDDVATLIGVLEKLLVRGNTVLVIEHNLDLIKVADYIIDMGPEGGAGGGKVVAVGTPEEVANNPKSHTGMYLGKLLKKAKKKT